MEGMTSLMRIPFARRGWFSGANSIRLREGDRLDANSIRLERLTLWVRNRSLWRGWRNWCKFHSLVKGGILWRNPIPCWGNPLEENSILLEEGAPLKRILFVMDRGRPMGWIWFTRRREPLGRGETLSRRLPFAWRRHPFAVERGDCWGERHSLDEFEKRATWTGWTPPWSESYSHWGLEPSCCRAQPGHLLTKGTSLMRTASGSREIPPSLLGVSPAMNQSEALVRTATVTNVTAEVVPWTRTVWRGPRPRC